MSYKLTINQKYQLLKPEIKEIEKIFSSSDTSVHKARNELKTVTIKSINLIIKSFKVPNFLNKFVYSFLRGSKASKSYHYSLKLKSFAPEPIAYIEFYKFGLLFNSYFISENFQYDFTIREPLLDDKFENREGIFKAFAYFTLQLHNAGIFHNDYSPGNILIKKENDKFIFKVVDVNRMHFFDLDETSRAKNFSKLWASDDELTIMSNEYMKHYACSDDFTQKVLAFSNKNKNFKNFKKKIKKKFL